MPKALTSSPQTAKESKNRIETRTEQNQITNNLHLCASSLFGLGSRLVVVSWFCSGPCFWPRFSVLAFLYLDTPALFAALWQPKSVAPNAISSAGIWVKLQQIKYNSAGGSDCDSHAKESGLGANHYYFYGVLQSGKKKRNPTETEANSGVQTSTSHPTTEIINSIKMPCN